jgi:hypothetical protein
MIPGPSVCVAGGTNGRDRAPAHHARPGVPDISLGRVQTPCSVTMALTTSTEQGMSIRAARAPGRGPDAVEGVGAVSVSVMPSPAQSRWRGQIRW